MNLMEGKQFQVVGQLMNFKNSRKFKEIKKMDGFKEMGQYHYYKS
jgi:hypothetical protein